MKIQAASIVALTLSGSHAFIPSSLSHNAIQPHSSSSPFPKQQDVMRSQVSALHRLRTKASTALQMASSEDFDQTKYTEAAWATLAALPACAENYSSTSVEAPMLLGILLNPTKYQAGECVM